MGGGGDGGYEARQQEIERKKQQARDALNALFGVGSSDPDAIAASLGPAPDKAKFTSGGMQFVQGPAEGGDYVNDPTVFDEAAYNKALSDYNAKVAKRRTDLSQNAGARDALYQGVRENAFTSGRRRIDEDQQDAARKLKFELFATGQAGGSGDIDQNSRLKRTYNQGLIDLGAKADAAKADFRGQDEQTRLALLQSIDAGMDQGSALSSATQRMQIAADKAAADANGTTLGNLFNTGSEFYNQSQYARGRQAGQQDWWNNYAPAGRKSATAATGVTTRLPGE